MSGKILILFIVLPVLLLLGGGAAVYFVFLNGGPNDAHAEETDEGARAANSRFIDPSMLVFYPMPEMLVNLNTAGNGKMYLKLNVELELRQGADLDALESVMPRIIDKFQVYLRELRLEDLHGSSGMYRVKEELLRRVNLAVRPIVVHDVLFKELIIQ